MKRWLSAHRLTSAALAAGLVFVLAGDRALSQSALIGGIDPLEVLDLQIKPNIIVVVDSSGSMTDTLYNNGTGGDHPFSKMFLAKQVLNQVIQQNSNNAQFMFGQYRYQNNTTFSNTGIRVNGSPTRFAYHTQSWAAAGPFPVEGPSPSMASTELSLNSFYAFQWIQSTPQVTNDGFVFTENGAPGNCTVSIATGFYQTPAAFATAMAAAMNSCSAPDRLNTYNVTAGASTFTISRTAGTRQYRIRWTLSTVRGVLNRATAADTNFSNNNVSTGDFRINLADRPSNDDFTEFYDPDGTAGPSPSRNITTYFFNGQRLWNGETIYVTSGGTACGVIPATVATMTNPPSVDLQLVTNCASPAASTSGAPVKFTFSGGRFGGAGSCQGFAQNVALIPCDQTGPAQFTNIQPFLDRELLLDPTGAVQGYQESTDGIFTVTGTPVPGGIRASGATPISQSLNDIRGIFGTLWNTGQAVPFLDAIKNHVNPKEKTIVLFVTDGDQNCAPFSLGGGSAGNPYNPTNMIQSDAAALGAAAAAMNLYAPLSGSVNSDGTINGDAASSVTTYLVGFGSGASTARLNWIAWGGSGMVKTTANVSGQPTWTTIPTAAQRAQCTSCVDAFIAPDAATLAAVLSAIINQGASSGEFTAQQSLTAPVLEYVDLAPPPPIPLPPFSALNDQNRYNALTPVRYLSTFRLPGYQGQLQAFVNQGGVAVQKWNAGQILTQGVLNGMAACSTAGNSPAVAGECLFSQLHGGATDANVRTSSAAIKRRVYTTSQNGYFGVTVDNLLNRQAPFRIPLWPPTQFNVAPPSDATPGLFDNAMGLPTTATLVDFTDLQTTFHACKGMMGAVAVDAAGSGHPCSASNPLATRVARAKREARELILAFMAGAAFSPDNNADPRRVSSGANAGQILYKSKNWVLADSTLATPAVLGQPVQSTPDATPYVAEYTLFRDGVPTDPAQIYQGFGLRNPDVGVVTPPAALKPVMTVVYAGANDMLHAFRAGPSEEPTASCTNTATVECGGQELWGFVPFDSLATLKSRLSNEPQKRDPHDYMIARGIRVADVFVPGPRTISISGQTKTIAGLWRTILLFGRGAGGKGLTVLDVTAPGPFFQTLALDTTGPIPYWSRGNPDTNDGTPTGFPNGSAFDLAQYAKMGQTWSLPAIGLVDPAKHVTPRTPAGVEFVAWAGSGYGAVGEGTTFYSLDVLTGDVIKAADVEVAASAAGIARIGLSYENALAANPAAFNPGRFDPGKSSHAAASRVTRVYMGDVHGRVWKFLTDDSSVAIPVADLGADQAVGSPASLIGLPPDASATKVPYIFVTSGNDKRSAGPFRVFGFRDDGDDFTTTTAGTTTANGVTTFLPAVSIFARTYDAGPVVNPAAPSPFPIFRGTAQPATAFTDQNPARAEVFFAGTRFNPPGSAFAPVPPPYPCRSTFDSIIYALQADTGSAAYDLQNNPSDDDAYVIFRDSRIVGIQAVEDPSQGSGAALAKDEGLLNPAVPTPPPPPPGQPPKTVTADVKPELKPGQPIPAIRFGSTACQ